jgi:hypothetical protein
MRFLNASLVIGSMMVVGALPAAAQSPLAAGSQARVRLAAVSDPKVDKGTYTQKAQDDVQEWQQKLHKFSVKAEAKGQQDTIAAGHDLNEAWIKTEVEARKLQTASAEDWESAKVSYEKASRELAREWDKIRPEDK